MDFPAGHASPSAPRPICSAEHGDVRYSNPVACAAGLAVISYIQSHDLLDRVKQMGLQLADKVMSLDDPRIATGRGRGCCAALS